MSLDPVSHRTDPYADGWRQVERVLEDGTTVIEQIPLPPGAFLDPQPGDVMIQGSVHYRVAKDLYNRFEIRYLDDPRTGVFGDLKMRWGIPKLEEPAPDVAIVPNLTDKDAPRDSFDCLAEGTRPSLAIEVMSPRHEGDDTDKVAIYECAGVTEYLIIKPYGPKHQVSFSIWGYRLVGGAYRQWRANPDGSLTSLTTGVRFAVRADGRDIEVFDAKTGALMRSMEQTELARAREAERAEQEARRADAALARAARLEAELARLRAGRSDPDEPIDR